MPPDERLHFGAFDPVASQAERILVQRQTRAQVIDPELLGEPGWDILLCAFIAHRRGLVCRQDDVAKKIDLSVPVTKRWVDLLAIRGMLVQRNDFFEISEQAERKLHRMFELQIREAVEALAGPTAAHALRASGQT